MTSIHGQIKSNQIQPIHKGEITYSLYKAVLAIKNQQKPLSFGSASKRVIKQFQPKNTTSEIECEINDKIFSKQQFKNKMVPFGSSLDRFQRHKKNHPGPGSYLKIQQQTKLSKRRVLPVMYTLKQKKKQQITDELGPGIYDVRSSFSIKNNKQQIKQKFKETKLKYMKYHPIQTKPQGLQSQNKQNYQTISNKPKSTKIQNQLHIFNRFRLKQNTQKYLPQTRQTVNHHNQSYIYPLYRNFSPCFIQSQNNQDKSLIQSAMQPGPGWYKPKLSSSKKALKWIFQSKVPRQKQLKKVQKQKQKLSTLL